MCYKRGLVHKMGYSARWDGTNGISTTTHVRARNVIAPLRRRVTVWYGRLIPEAPSLMLAVAISSFAVLPDTSGSLSGGDWRSCDAIYLAVITI